MKKVISMMLVLFFVASVSLSSAAVVMNVSQDYAMSITPDDPPTKKTTDDSKDKKDKKDKKSKKSGKDCGSTKKSDCGDSKTHKSGGC